MGKVRHSKKSRVHLKAPSNQPKEDASDSQTVASEVQGLRISILNLLVHITTVTKCTCACVYMWCVCVCVYVCVCAYVPVHPHHG